MKLNKDSIEFKSDNVLFDVEKSGKKSNTERLLTRTEAKEVEDWLFFGKFPQEPKKIIIHSYDMQPNSASRHRRFTQELTDVRSVGKLLGFELYVFSW